MRTPKYDIGTVFYATSSYTTNRGHKYQFLPSSFIIKEVKINSNDIIYSGTQYALLNDDNDEMEIGQSEFTEKEISDKFSFTSTEIIQRIYKTLETGFSALIKQVDKDRLSKVLHGK
jgi:hypothetical protein